MAFFLLCRIKKTKKTFRNVRVTLYANNLKKGTFVETV